MDAFSAISFQKLPGSDASCFVNNQVLHIPRSHSRVESFNHGRDDYSASSFDFWTGIPDLSRTSVYWKPLDHLLQRHSFDRNTRPRPIST